MAPHEIVWGIVTGVLGVIAFLGMVAGVAAGDWSNL